MKIETHVAIGGLVIIEELLMTPKEELIKKVGKIALLILTQFCIARTMKYRIDPKEKKCPSGSVMFVWMTACGRGMKYPSPIDRVDFSAVCGWLYALYRVTMTEARLQDVALGGAVGIGLGFAWDRII